MPRRWTCCAPSSSGAEEHRDERDGEDDGGLGQRHGCPGRAAAAQHREYRQRRHPRLPPQDRILRAGLFAGEDAPAVRTGPVRLDDSELIRVYDPTHPLAGKDGYFEGSNVNLVVEIADAREANRSYEANLRMFDQARQMASALLDLLRR